MRRARLSAATPSPVRARECWFTRVSESEANLLAGERRAQPSASRQSCEVPAMPWCCESSCLPATGLRSGSLSCGPASQKCKGQTRNAEMGRRVELGGLARPHRAVEARAANVRVCGGSQVQRGAPVRSQPQSHVLCLNCPLAQVLHGSPEETLPRASQVLL